LVGALGDAMVSVPPLPPLPPLARLAVPPLLLQAAAAAPATINATAAEP
jgi:hypothetical protein